MNKLARTTGANPAPEGKLRLGYRFEPERFALAGLSSLKPETVRAPGIVECPVQMEAAVEAIHGAGEADPAQKGRIATIEVRVQRAHLHDGILWAAAPTAWIPMRGGP